MNDEVSVTDSRAVRTLAINRPERLNAMSIDTAEALEQAMRAAADNTVRAVVLTGFEALLDKSHRRQ